MVSTERSALEKLLRSSRVLPSVRKDPSAAEEVAVLTKQVFDGYHHTDGTYELLVASVESYDNAQADSAKLGKVDLTAELAAFADTPVLSDFMGVLLGPTPDKKTLKALGTPFASKTKFEASGVQSETVLQLRPQVHFMPDIGETLARNEVMREVYITCRYAKWRDRKVRRLARVRVVSTFVFAVPTAYLIEPVVSTEQLQSAEESGRESSAE